MININQGLSGEPPLTPPEEPPDFTFEMDLEVIASGTYIKQKKDPDKLHYWIRDFIKGIDLVNHLGGYPVTTWVNFTKFHVAQTPNENCYDLEMAFSLNVCFSLTEEQYSSSDYQDFVPVVDNWLAVLFNEGVKHMVSVKNTEFRVD